MVSRTNSKENSFFKAFGLQQGDVVCFTGAGGKTSLMFRLAQEARALDLKVLVTTSTKIRVPAANQYDALDLSGKLFVQGSVLAPGIYVGGLPGPVAGKMTGVHMDLLFFQRNNFDLLLIEADGAATKPLKGWNSTEPVIPDFTTKTIGIIDIQTIGSIICEALVHRLDIFSEITGCKAGEPVSLHHLARVIHHEQGLFSQSQGVELLYINKVESITDQHNVDGLRAKVKNIPIVAGSVNQGIIYV
jgi:probable selenium-dependent hydroxylase accessory protein YqeC